MSQLNERGARSERGSALWGTGGRGGDRSSVLWGKGGRGMLVAAIMAVALSAPLAATAGPGKGKSPVPAPVVAPAPSTDPAPPDASDGRHTKTWVDQSLLNKANSSPNGKIDVIITSSAGTAGADRAFKWLSRIAAKGESVGGEQNLNLVGGITASLPARLVAKLQSVPGLIVTPNAPVRLSGSVSGLSSTQLWPYVSGNAYLWPGDTSTYSGKIPAIAVVDSGIQNRSDFGNRVIASVNLSTLPGNTAADTGTTDQAGHGTFVAGIAAGAAPDLAGASPGAPLVSVKVMNSNGQALTSDVIAACQWILANKDAVQHPRRELLAALELRHELVP